MKTLLTRFLKKTPLHDPLTRWAGRRARAREILTWERNGRPVPPPHAAKQRTLRTFAQRYKLKILVETGTCFGDMLEAMKHDFDRIYSIELSNQLHQKARQRFQREHHIELIQGDSAVELRTLLERIDRPALFWLDGHYSSGGTARGDKDTPLCDELNHIFDAPDLGHVIVIDDARLLGTDPAYPALQDLCDFIRSKKPDAHIAVEDDSVRITCQ